MPIIQTFDRHLGGFVDLEVEDPEMTSPKQYEQHRKEVGLPPLPPTVRPPKWSLARELESQLEHASELEQCALRILSRVTEIRESVKRMGGAK